MMIEWARKHPAYLAAVLVIGSAVLGMLLVFYATRSGVGVGSDATIYLVSARNLLAGNGLGWFEPDGFHRLDYYPPLYPLVVAFSALLTGDVVSGARWLNVLLFGGLVLLLGWWFYRATARPVLAGVLSGVLAVSPVLIGVSVWAMSEPLFLLTGFGGLALLSAYLVRPRGWVLILAAVLVGLSFLSRYLGVAFVITGALLLLLARGTEPTWRARLGRAVVFGAVAVFPMAVWLMLDLVSSGTVGGRSGMPAAQFLPRFVGTFAALEPIVLFWLLPDGSGERLPGLLRTLLYVLAPLTLAGLGYWVWRRSARSSGVLPPGAARLAQVMGLFVLVYVLVLAMLQAVIYPPVAVDMRMLSPVHVAFVTLIFCVGYLAARAFAPVKPWAGALVLLAVLLFAGSYAYQGGLLAREHRFGGLGYTRAVWRSSSTLDAVRDLPVDVPVITNDKAAIMFHTGRAVYEVAEIYQNTPAETFTRYGAGEDRAQRVFREGGALVLFDASLEEDFEIYGERIDERLTALVDGLYPYFMGEDGAIYFYQPPGQE